MTSFSLSSSKWRESCGWYEEPVVPFGYWGHLIVYLKIHFRIIKFSDTGKQLLVWPNDVLHCFWYLGLLVCNPRDHVASWIYLQNDCYTATSNPNRGSVCWPVITYAYTLHTDLFSVSNVSFPRPFTSRYFWVPYGRSLTFQHISFIVLLNGLKSSSGINTFL